MAGLAILLMLTGPLLGYKCRDCGCDVFRGMDGVVCGTCAERYRDHETDEYV